MTTVTGQVLAPDGTAPAAAVDRQVTITLVDQSGVSRPGYTAGGEIVSPTILTAARDGTWSANLTGNASVTCDWGATLYRVEEGYSPDQRGRCVTYISVPASGGPYAASALRVTPPGGAGPQITGYLPLSGGTLTGALTLAGDPVSPLQAATRQYVDNHSAGGSGSGVSSVNGMTGAVTLTASNVGAIASGDRNAPGGVAGLDGSSLLSAAQVPTLDASKIGTGVLATGRIPDLSGTYVKVAGGSIITIGEGDTTTQAWAICLPTGDRTAAGAPDAWAVYVNTGTAQNPIWTRTGYADEYGLLRSIPPSDSMVPLRVKQHSGTQTGDLFQATTIGNVVLASIDATGGGHFPALQVGGTPVATDHGYSPADYGLAAWVGDPGYTAGVIATPVGIVHMVKIKIPRAMTINNVNIWLGGTITLTSGQNFAALFDVNGNQVGVTPDQTSNWSGGGPKACPLTASYTANPPFIYGAVLFNGSANPNMPRYTQSPAAPNMSLSPGRFLQYGSALTAMPLSIPMGSAVADATAAFWMGVS